MLSITRCREVMGPDCELSDRDLEAVRNQLAAIANIAFSWIRRQRENLVKGGQLGPSLENVPLEFRYEVEERAAIYELKRASARLTRSRAPY